MKILVTGGNGEFCKHLVNAGKEHSFLTPSKKEADVRDYDNLNWYFHNHHKELQLMSWLGKEVYSKIQIYQNPRRN